MNCDLKKAFINIQRFEMLMYGSTLASTLISQLAFLHNSYIWLWKVSFKSNLKPKSFSHSLFTIPKSSVFILISSFTLLNSKWHLSALPLKILWLNQLNKVFKGFSKEAITPSISSAIRYVVLLVYICCYIYVINFKEEIR